MGYKVAIVGLGNIGKKHYSILQDYPELERLYLIDNDEVLRTLQGDKFNSLDHFLEENPICDLVVIATPNGLHFSQTKKTLEQKYNVLVEKPITLNLEKLNTLISISQKNKTQLFTALQLRFSPVVQWVKKLIDEGSLGEIYLCNIACYWNRNTEYYTQHNWRGSKELDGGVLFNQFSHFIDILHHFFESPKVESKLLNNYKHKNCTEFPDSGVLSFSSGSMLGNMVFTTATYQKNYNSTFTIIAEKGTISIEGQYLNQLKYSNIEKVSSPIFSSTKDFHSLMYDEIFKSLKNNTPSILDAKNCVNGISFMEKASY